LKLQLYLSTEFLKNKNFVEIVLMLC